MPVGLDALRAIRDDRTLSGHAKSAYLTLWLRQPDIRPSMPLLAGDMGFSESSARKGLRELESAGLVEITRTKASTGDNNSNEYRLIAPHLGVKSASAQQSAPPQPGVPETPPGVPETPPGVPETPPGVPETPPWYATDTGGGVPHTGEVFNVKYTTEVTNEVGNEVKGRPRGTVPPQAARPAKPPSPDEIYRLVGYAATDVWGDKALLELTPELCADVWARFIPDWRKVGHPRNVLRKIFKDHGSLDGVLANTPTTGDNHA